MNEIDTTKQRSSQTVRLPEKEIPKQLQLRSKLRPYRANLYEEQLKEARKCKTSLDYHCLKYISKGTQPAMNAEQSNTTHAVNDSEDNNNYPASWQPSCSNSTKWSNSKRPRCGECFGNIFSKAKPRGTDEKIRYRNSKTRCDWNKHGSNGGN